MILLIAGNGQSAPAPVLDSVDAVLRLTNKEAQHHLRVKLRAQVTLSRWDHYWFFIQDGGAGLYMAPPPKASGFPKGDWVVVEGHTAAGAFAPIMQADGMQLVGHGPLPAPFRVGKTS